MAEYSAKELMDQGYNAAHPKVAEALVREVEDLKKRLDRIERKTEYGKKAGG